MNRLCPMMEMTSDNMMVLGITHRLWICNMNKYLLVVSNLLVMFRVCSSSLLV